MNPQRLNRKQAGRVFTDEGFRREELDSMVTNYPYRIASRSEIAESQPSVVAGWEHIGTTMLRRAREIVCGLHGHDNFLQFEQDRMCLKCVSCGRETPGWDLNEMPPTRRLHGDARRHVLARQPLANVRRIA